MSALPDQAAPPAAQSGDVDPNGDIVDLARSHTERRERLHATLGAADPTGEQLDAVLRLVAIGRALDVAACGQAEHWRRRGGRA